ncbi:peptide/nickel transport system ATP-binding protein [Bradyrhizobium sp. JR6.1]
MHEPAASPGDDVILSVKDLAVHFPLGGGLLGGGQRLLRAVDGIDLELKRGECLGLVGESGCGKSTVALSLLGLLTPTRGRIVLDGHVVTGQRSVDRKLLARTAQMVFQDPYASLNPRQTVRRTLEDPLRLHGVTAQSEIDGRIAAMLKHVGLRPEQAGRYPHEFSGGQRQRIGIARALILNPKIVICDEPVSALDVSIRAQIINLLLELKESLGLSYIMISHDLGVVEHMSDRVAVMYLGRIVETGGWREIFERPAHPYTQTHDRRDSRSATPRTARDDKGRASQSSQSAGRMCIQPTLSLRRSDVPARARAFASNTPGRARGPVLAS